MRNVQKTPYQMPLLSEINGKIKGTSGFKVASFFSGCGGSSLGYKLAGHEVLYASEFIPEARETYELNHPGTLVDGRDIRDVKPADVMNACKLDVGELDILDGSPPCAAFSSAGKGAKGYGVVKKYSSTEQRVDDLFFEFTRQIKGIQPRVFVAENVAGLTKGAAKGYLLNIWKEMQACGYQIGARIVNAGFCGVAQHRERTIFIGIRNDLARQLMKAGTVDVASYFPLPDDWSYSVREAFNPDAKIGERGQRESLYDPENGDEAWIMPPGKMRTLWDASVKMGEPWFNAVHQKLYGTESSFNHVRVLLDMTAPTIVQGSICLYHEKEPRTLSVNEAARLSSFPDDFRFTGPYKVRWERIGRAVPPKMMGRIAAAVRGNILEPLRELGAI